MLTLIRGLPGSGKSTLAKHIQWSDLSNKTIHLEADMFFQDDQGVYKFDPEKLHAAHRWCLDTTRILLNQGHRIIVSNTFTRVWEMEKYLALKTTIDLIECHADYGNVHGVTPEKVQQLSLIHI